MKKLLLFKGASFNLRLFIMSALFSILAISMIQGQQSRTKTFNPYASTNLIKYSNGTYSHNNDNKVGYELVGGNDYKYNRHGLQFSIGTIPTNATITSCSLSFAAGYNYGAQDGTIRFTKLRWDWPALFDDQQEYNLIGSGDLINSISISSETNYNIALNNLAADIQSAIMSSYPYISMGAYNQYEGLFYGTSFSNQVLTINYTIPTPGQAENLRVEGSPTAGSFTLKWDAPSGNVSGYKVYKNGSYYNYTSSTQMSICGLLPSSYYDMYVIAVNSYGDGEPSDPLNDVPTLSSAISGNGLICSSEDYYVNNVPSGATITWSTPSSSINLISDEHANPCSFQYYSIGEGTIIAEITSSCENYTLTFDFHSGPYSSSDYPISGPDEAPCNSYVYFSIPSLVGATSINWDWPDEWTYVSGQGTEYLELITGSSDYSGSVAVGVDNECGQSGSYASRYVSIYGFCGYSMTVSPNPASDNVTVNIIEPQIKNSASNDINLNSSQISNKPAIYKIMIIDKMGVVHNSFIKNSKSFVFSVQNLNNGNYIVLVTSGDIKIAVPLVVIH